VRDGVGGIVPPVGLSLLWRKSVRSERVRPRLGYDARP